MNAHNRLDLTNQIFGRLIAIKFVGKNRFNNGIWECRCSCGEIINVLSSKLKSGKTKSCGCLKSEISKKNIEKAHTANVTHGMSDSPEYAIWLAMFQRCENPNNNKYHLYGSRGIKVCDRWRLFENFIADMGMRPSDEHSIDRRNENGHYEPNNCYWATIEQQNSHLRKRVKVN